MTSHPSSLAATPAERCVIGSILRQPELLPDVVGHVKPEDFACPYAGATLRLMKARYADGYGIDEVSLPEAIIRSGRPDRYPDPTELLQWADEVPSTQALPYWLREIRECATLRAIRAAVREIDQHGRAGDTSAQLLDLMGKKLSEIAIMADLGKGPEQLGVTAEEVVQDLLSPKPEAAPIPTGIADLDEALGGGLYREDLVVIGGRPAMGKTALAMQIADNATIHGAAVLMFSAEMSKKKIALRLLASHADVDFASLRRPGKLTARQVADLQESAAHMHSIPWATDDRTSPTLETIVATARRHKLTTGRLDILVIDYFQILGFGRGELADKERMVYGLRDFAKDEGVCVVLLSQLNRELAKRADKRPTKADLKGCGGLEEAACVILFPYRPAADDESADPTEGEIIIDKHRDGEDGTVEVAWDGPAIRYKDRVNEFLGAR